MLPSTPFPPELHFVIVVAVDASAVAAIPASADAVALRSSAYKKIYWRLKKPNKKATKGGVSEYPEATEGTKLEKNTGERRGNEKKKVEKGNYK